MIRVALALWWFSTLLATDGGADRYIRFGPFVSKSECEVIRERVTDSKFPEMTTPCVEVPPTVLKKEQGPRS